MHPNKILVPVDFSPASDAALAHALTVADACGAEVEMLYVWAPREYDDASSGTIFADTPAGGSSSASPRGSSPASWSASVSTWLSWRG